VADRNSLKDSNTRTRSTLNGSFSTKMASLKASLPKLTMWIFREWPRLLQRSMALIKSVLFCHFGLVHVAHVIVSPLCEEDCQEIAEIAGKYLLKCELIGPT
jgi:hypothetical protein